MNVLHSSKSVEWYTPAVPLAIARSTMGGIDLDPASCATANRLVGATRFYTRADNGLRQPWRGRVWLNPPYGKDKQGRSATGVWLDRLLADFSARRVDQACVLVNATPDRAWFHPLWRFPVCFAWARVRFWRRGQVAHQPTHGNVLVYLGRNHEAFADAVASHAFGHIAWPRPERVAVPKGA